MLWNWNTVGSCFLASSWKITSTSVFAGSCIGVILLVISLEMLRRAVKEYDRFLAMKHLNSHITPMATSTSSKNVADEASPTPACSVSVPGGYGYRPTIAEQAVRALLHMLQFAVAYFVML
jgi:copper transporter 1